MNKTLLVLGLVLAMAFGSAKRAEACGGGGSGSGNYDGLIAAALVVGGTYVGVTAGMAIKDIAGDNPSMGYGIAETLIHTPIALMWGTAAYNEATSPYGSNSSGLMIMTAVHGALAAHGIYTIVKRARAPKHGAHTVPSHQDQGPPGMFQVGRVSASVTPAPMQNGAGLGISGAF